MKFVSCFVEWQLGSENAAMLTPECVLIFSLNHYPWKSNQAEWEPQLSIAKSLKLLWKKVSAHVSRWMQRSNTSSLPVNFPWITSYFLANHHFLCQHHVQFLSCSCARTMYLIFGSIISIASHYLLSLQLCTCRPFLGRCCSVSHKLLICENNRQVQSP